MNRSNVLIEKLLEGTSSVCIRLNALITMLDGRRSLMILQQTLKFVSSALRSNLLGFA